MQYESLEEVLNTLETMMEFFARIKEELEVKQAIKQDQSITNV